MHRMEATMNIDNTTIYRILNFGAKSWWAHKQLRDLGKHAEARREERRNILSDLVTVRSALYILVGHGRFVIVTGPYSNVSGYGEMEHPLVLACVLRGVPCVGYSKLDRETTIILPIPGPTFPNPTGQVRLLDDVSFAVHAAIANFAGAQLYNIDPGTYERYVVSKYGNDWMVIDTENEKITEANARLIAKAIMTDHNGWENSEFWKGEKWLPITFWNNEIKDEEHLAALMYSWGNDVDVFNESGECRFHFAHKDWSATISENMGLIDIYRIEKEMVNYHTETEA
jgi:hypothetical protein